MFKGKTMVLAVAAAAFVTLGYVCNDTRVTAAVATPHARPTPDKSLFSEYKGIKIGMLATDVRTALGKARETSDAQDQFIFSDSESAQFYYDAAHKVNAIMITFQGDVTKAPSAKDVFGEDVAPNAEGTIFKMERYPKAGYWISYTRTTTGDQMVNIAMQKM